ncbi:hypothetical protein BDK51DRAFT_45750 [Blyttiomyces helicus]|uniref:Signal sequence receptor subunit gamma n=1 Tax=Blyttiomyces helicus TaxID=388810 RepID=A0A4P9WL49_9FUNG|nr:hypothetical protein BDK51DRAFT_45750 [Blyttiomyces helicus]|eukprot:RKO93749.1 hypothetical protein BDK51DRAFT_45750 [Blyttiomyces helicus]
MATDEFQGAAVLSRTPTFASSILYLIVAGGVAFLPLFLHASTGLSFAGDALFIVVVTPIVVAGLWFSYNNVAYTSQVWYHRAAKDATASKKTLSKVAEAAQTSAITTASVYYALFFNNLAFLVLFSLFTLGASGLHPGMRYAVATLIPVAALGYLTSPAAAPAAVAAAK